MEYALRGVPYGPDFSARLTMLKTELPGILKEINQAPKTAGMLSEIIANAIRHGMEARQGSEFGNARAMRGYVKGTGGEPQMVIEMPDQYIAEHQATGARTVFNKAPNTDPKLAQVFDKLHTLRENAARHYENAGEMEHENRSNPGQHDQGSIAKEQNAGREAANLAGQHLAQHGITDLGYNGGHWITINGHHVYVKIDTRTGKIAHIATEGRKIAP